MYLVNELATMAEIDSSRKQIGSVRGHVVPHEAQREKF